MEELMYSSTVPIRSIRWQCTANYDRFTPEGTAPGKHRTGGSTVSVIFALFNSAEFEVLT
jgi:hypothetical protein